MDLITKAAAVLACTMMLAACTPTVKVEAPSEPITINLNVKIDHEIRVKVDKDLENIFSEDSDLF
ncbi:MAG: YnbE family lipoprotein [Porticoccaceae bacterium]